MCKSPLVLAVSMTVWLLTLLGIKYLSSRKQVSPVQLRPGGGGDPNVYFFSSFMLLLVWRRQLTPGFIYCAKLELLPSQCLKTSLYHKNDSNYYSALQASLVRG